jgi:prolyl oligopeptidase PreP (S9A serine peptidase family)
LIAGESDVRVPGWHARKMAARLQDATSSTERALLRVLPNTAHAGGTDSAAGTDAEWLGFLMQWAGLDVIGKR